MKEEETTMDVVLAGSYETTLGPLIQAARVVQNPTIGCGGATSAAWWPDNDGSPMR